MTLGYLKPCVMAQTKLIQFFLAVYFKNKSESTESYKLYIFVFKDSSDLSIGILSFSNLTKEE